MQKITYLFILLSSFVFTQEINKVDTKGKKQGKWVKMHPNSKVIDYIGHFKDDKPIDTFFYFYPSSKKRAIIVHNPKTGRSLANLFHENEVIMAIGIYKNQLKDSVWTYFGPSGKISYKESYVKGKLNGIKTVFYIPEDIADKSVLVAIKSTYVNDVLHGEEYEFFEDGSIKSKGLYENGLRTGKYVVNHSNGTNMIVENYKNGKKHGWCYGYDESGKQLGKRFYKEGVELKGKELDNYFDYCKKNKIDPLK